MIFQGVQAVALPLVQDFGYTREIEDRVLAPMPVWAVAFEKVASGAIQAVIAVARGVRARRRSSPRRRCTSACTGSTCVTLLPLAAIMSAALGLTIGTAVEPRQVPLIFSLLVIPMTFLGAVYYPWQSLIAAAVAEVERARQPAHLRQRRHAPVAHERACRTCRSSRSTSRVVGFTAVFLKLGIDGFKKRVLS